MSRMDKLDELGVQVYDLMGGEPLIHPDIAALVRHMKSRRGSSNLVTIITNGFLLTAKGIRALNEAALDFMQVSVDLVEPTAASKKSLKSVLPRLRILAQEAQFKVEIQTVLNDETLETYDAFRRSVEDLPFDFGFSIMHGRGGRIAIQGEKFLSLLSRYGVFEGVNFYEQHLREMLQGDFSRPWKCLAGFKFLYVNALGEIQWCSQQRQYRFPLDRLTLGELRNNDHHKPCEAGCCLGCVRMISHTLGEPMKTLGASIRLALIGARKEHPRQSVARTQPCDPPAQGS
jgi:MoaA/NifB/PqqE/SkfB family radical SAM enzyme